MVSIFSFLRWDTRFHLSLQGGTLRNTILVLANENSLCCPTAYPASTLKARKMRVLREPTLPTSSRLFYPMLLIGIRLGASAPNHRWHSGTHSYFDVLSEYPNPMLLIGYRFSPPLMSVNGTHTTTDLFDLSDLSSKFGLPNLLNLFNLVAPSLGN